MTRRGVEALESELLDVFRNIYNFKVDNFKIPSVGSQRALLDRLDAWCGRNDGDGTLRIIVYSGHAALSGTIASDWYLAGRTDQHGHLQGPTLNWWAVRSFIEQHSGDTCYIFDCCSAGSRALGDHDGSEFMAASGWEGTSTANPTYSLTQVLIETLRDLNGRPETLAGIYTQVFRFAHQNQVGASPVYVPKRGSPSVTLSREPPREIRRRSLERKSRRVLIQVRVRNDMPHDYAQWSAWLAHYIPPDVVWADVTVEGIFTGSTILLLTLPVEVWAMMPRNDPAYSFVAHVTSHNIISSAQTTTLPTRPSLLSGTENQRPYGLWERLFDGNRKH
ncbi:unnamed protein product [Penicillium egyptiacum]|uniref:Caspase domain-containing protein n=1 Tax=Penicillium egyptiacum TaxID=1303716 RepID=A0A9W4KP67_9EURO|nr:unnamed protein product [Penicillium egyptiacum]